MPSPIKRRLRATDFPTWRAAFGGSPSTDHLETVLHHMRMLASLVQADHIRLEAALRQLNLPPVEWVRLRYILLDLTTRSELQRRPTARADATKLRRMVAHLDAHLRATEARRPKKFDLTKFLANLSKGPTL